MIGRDLGSAVARTLALDSEPAGATVLIDGETRGQSPVTLEGICAGTHVVEFRSSVGRAVERVSLDPDASLTVRGRVRPAFALLGADFGDADPRLAVEKTFQAVESVVLYAPPADIVKEQVTQTGASPDWFGLGERRAGAAEVERIRLNSSLFAPRSRHE